MIKKLLINLLIFVFIIITFSFSIIISYKLTFSQKNIINIINKSGYVYKTKENLEDKMSNYVDKSIYLNFITKENIQNDVLIIITRFFNQNENVDESIIKENIKTQIKTDDNLKNILSDLYVDNIFITKELQMIENSYHTIENLIKYIVFTIVFILLILINGLYLLTRKSKSNKFIKILFSNSILLLILNIIIKSKEIYYLNSYVSLIINNLLNKFILYNYMIILLSIITIILFYIIYFYKRKDRYKKSSI